jgi:hypothetical protein
MRGGIADPKHGGRPVRDLLEVCRNCRWYKKEGSFCTLREVQVGPGWRCMNFNMPTLDDLWREFAEKRGVLQERCPHPETKVGWYIEWWAAGHPTGSAVRVCGICKKVLKRVPLETAKKKGYLKKERYFLREVS